MKISTTVTIIACTAILACTTIYVTKKWSEHKRAEMVTEELGSSALGQLLSITPQELEEANHRANCIITIRNMQQAVRSHQNLSGLNSGDALDIDDVIGPGKFLETAPECPGGGSYQWVNGRVPKIGELMIRCSIEDHIPSGHSDW